MNIQHKRKDSTHVKWIVLLACWRREYGQLFKAIGLPEVHARSSRSHFKSLLGTEIILDPVVVDKYDLVMAVQLNE